MAGTLTNLPTGVFTVVGEADFSYFYFVATHAFVNRGTFIHSGAGTTAFNVLFDNDGGTVQVDAGLVQLGGGGSFGGDASLTAGTLQLTGGCRIASWASLPAMDV